MGKETENLHEANGNLLLDYSLLQKAICDEDKERLLKLCVQCGNAINDTYDGISAIHLAAIRGSIISAGVLLDYGADINLSTEDGTTPIIFAIEYKHTELVLFLCGRGANINTPVDCGNASLNFSAMYGYITIGKILIEHGADINVPCVSADAGSYENMPPQHSLITAIEHRQTAFVRFLCEEGADINTEMDGFTPLHLAITMEDKKSAEIVETLCAFGANVKSDYLMMLAVDTSIPFDLETKKICGILIGYMDIATIDSIFKKNDSNAKTSLTIMTSDRKETISQLCRLRLITYLDLEKNSLFYCIPIPTNDFLQIIELSLREIFSSSKSEDDFKYSKSLAKQYLFFSPEAKSYTRKNGDEKNVKAEEHYEENNNSLDSKGKEKEEKKIVKTL